MRTIGVVWSCLLFSFAAAAASISLTADTTMPDPNDEVTVWVHTDEPLLFMQLDAFVRGDATITSAMSEADCNDFGWEIGWGFEPVIDEPNGWVSIGGIKWAADANDIVGYFKFRYNSGYVTIYIDQENSAAGNWGTNFAFSDEAISFGEMVLPPLIERNEPTPVIAQCPPSSSSPPRDELDSFAGWPQQAMLEMLDLEPTVIEINSDITTNQVWDANNVYYITDVNGIDVQALLIIEPGTTVIFGYRCGLYVNNGGTLISKGTPDKPIIFTPDWLYYDYPDYIGYYWQVLPYDGPYYYSPLYIEETASPATTIRYNMIEGAVWGILTDDIRLDNPIENNYLFGNIWGVYEFGPRLTDIRNNLCFFNDEAGIEAYLSPDPNDVPDTENILTIEHNTCDGSEYTFCGITVRGVADPNQAPTVHLLNNIVSGSYPDTGCYGLNLRDGAMYALVANTGYYDNLYDRNWEFDEYNAVYAETYPYYPYIGDKPYQHHYLIDGSAFIDAGSQYIEQTQIIGMTTNFNSLPDAGVIDIGFHHMDWDYVGGEGVAGTDIDDLIEISEYWLEYSPFDPNSPGYIDPNLYIFDPNHPELWIDPNFVSFGGDWNDDGFVDLADFAILAGMWQAAPALPDIVPVINGNPNSGWVAISVSGYTSTTQDIFAYINGKYVGKITGFQDGRCLGIDISEFGNKPQQLKLIAIDCDGQITCSGLTDIVYSSTLSYCLLPESYEPNEPIPFAAYNANIDNASVNVYADGGQLVWAQSFTANTIAGFIPANIVTSHDIDHVSFESSSGASVAKTTGVAHSPLSPPDPDVIAMLVRPDWWLNMHGYRTTNAVKTAFKNRGVKYVELKGKSATYANVAKYAPQLKYLYIDAHGNSSVQDGQNGILRTMIALYDVDVVSAKASDFVGTPPTWCKDPLPGRKEQTLKSFVTMGFTDLRFFQFDGCLGAHLTIHPGTGILVWGALGKQGLFDFPQNDMSVACGMADTSESRFYQAWFNESEARLIAYWPLETDYQQFSRNEWEALGEGEELYWALTEAIYQQDHFGPDDPVQNYRIKGQGDAQNFRIRSNP
ncbi:MAG: hypothetical protein LLF76_09265 [Planctomycetaceae bacterium]|nr:hypothetical protein [Planctomycetaceae bacterium]